MIYVYLVVLVLFLILFMVSRTENAAEYMKQGEEKPKAWEKYFIKAAIWCIRQKEKFLRKSIGKGIGRSWRSKEQLHKSKLGKDLKLLHPSLSQKQQLNEFYIKQYSTTLLVLFVGNILSLCVAVSAQTGGLIKEGNYINRKSYGQGGIEVALTAKIEGNEPENITYTVEEQKYTHEEIELLHQKFIENLAEIIKGDNESLETVTKNLNLASEIEGYPFKIEWESGSYAIIHTDGEVNNRELEEAQIVTLRAILRYDGIEYEEIFPVQVQPAVFTREEQLLQSIEASLEEQNQASRTGGVMILPDNIENKNVIWKEVIEDNSGYFFLLMCAASILIYFSKVKDVEKDLEKRKKELLLDYPEVVSKVTLYMGAGLSIRKTFYKMGEDYKRKGNSDKKRYAYEEILLLVNELQSGISETEAYARLGKRCQLQPYMKLGALLSQNIRKGSNDMLMMLRQEAASAFEERKNTARRLGEEAGTKLLMPMMMMLCIVMVIIMFPAFCSF
ncbi:MAG: hypothetical protein NC433_15530 [Clostridiales bacterium]|nr:hypothetical protein [Clostridiales bacterium]